MKRGLLNSKGAYVAIFLLGIVSLMGDVVYEGSRGLVPDYLRFLGASAFLVGLAGGLGEFLGYGLRLFSGVLADMTGAYWLFIFLGYGLIFSIPLLGMAGSWEIAVILVMLERAGKAFRSPSRDTLLSVISKDVGAGKAFGIHELLDQVGAVVGPLIVAASMFYTRNNYQVTFSLLLVPFLALLVALVYAYKKIGDKIIVEMRRTRGKEKLEKPYFVYTLAVMLNTVGLIPFALILYKASTILQLMEQQWIVPLIYLVIQGVDASVALIAGYAYDKFGVKVLALPFALSVFPPLFTVAATGLPAVMAAALFFGLVLGMQESIYRAAVSKFAPASSRGTAYGVFNTVYAVGLLLSGSVYGLLMDLNIPFAEILLFVILMQASAVVALMKADHA